MALSALLAIPLGVLLALSPRAEAFAFPMVGFLRYIPPSAFVPLFILWFGIGDFEKILVVFIAVAPYLLLLVFDIVKGVENDLLEAAYTLGATDRQVLFRVIFPATLPEIWDALRVMVGIAWSFVVLAEVVAATSGLGHLIITAQRFIQTARMIAAIVVIGLLGILTDYAFAWLRKRLFPWARQLSHA
jgi:NitT/TauT family transport system permease protein